MTPETQMQALAKTLILGVNAESHSQMVDLVKLAEMLCLGLTFNQIEASKLNAELELEKQR